MKIMILGAGAVGGYFGGRLAASGADVTFLVREGRARQLEDGLRIESPCGDAHLAVRTLLPGEAAPPPDIIMLACKAYGRTAALEAIDPQIPEGPVVLPVVTGRQHNTPARCASS